MRVPADRGIGKWGAGRGERTDSAGFLRSSWKGATKPRVYTLYTRLTRGVVPITYASSEPHTLGLAS